VQVRSFEIINADLRQLHDYLLEVGGFQFRAGGSGFFVLVGERFFARTTSTQAHMILAQLEADTVSIDAIAAGGGQGLGQFDYGSERWYLKRTEDLLTGFAERYGLELSELSAEQ